MTSLAAGRKILTVRPNNRTESQKRSSFIEEARRRQIVEVAIQTIAERGSAQTTLAEIAKLAGISKGLISYHFEGKDELIREVLAALVQGPAAYIKPRVDAAPTAGEKLRAYVEAFFHFLEANRSAYLAFVELWCSEGGSAARARFDKEAYEPARHYLSHIIEAGRATGEFRAVPTRTMASVVQAALDGVMVQWVFEPEAVDLAACRTQILDMLEHHLAPREAPRDKKGGP